MYFWLKKQQHYIAFYSQWIKFQLNRLKFESMLLWNIYSKLSVSNVICFLMNLGQFLVLFRFTSENVLREFVVIHYRYFIYYSLALYNNEHFKLIHLKHCTYLYFQFEPRCIEISTYKMQFPHCGLQSLRWLWWTNSMYLALLPYVLKISRSLLVSDHLQ